MSSETSLHLLSIDWDHAPAETRRALEFSREQRIALLAAMGAEAEEAEIEAAIVARPSGLGLYVCGASAARALTVILRAIASRGSLAMFRAVRSVEASERSAARCLMRHAMGLDGNLRSALGGLDEITQAAALAAEAGTLGACLTSLFGHASSAVWRARKETRFGRVELCREVRDVEALAVERIIEEELVSWQLLAETSPDWKSVYPSPEPASMLRLKVGHELLAQNSA